MTWMRWWPGLVAVVLCGASGADARPVLSGGDVRVTFSSPTACTVVLAVRVTDGSVSASSTLPAPIEHRIDEAPGGRVHLDGVEGADPAGESEMIGRTRALTVRPRGPQYTIRYRVDQPDAHAYRCPIWVPVVPADGVSREVRLSVRIPAGASVGGTMPTLRWSGAEGSAVLGHIPAFVHLPFAADGAEAPMNVARLMDVLAVTALVAGTALFLRRQIALERRR